ncbi:MAG: folate-binding protein [Hyphomonadaceae bacterium]|nr:folate-binding protein [Hyphomonadaceae bacterium]
MTLGRLPDRALLALNGPDAVTLLERLVTHTTANWQTGELRFGALLTPQGKVLVDFLSLRTETGVLMDLHEDALAILQPRLKLYKLRADVEIAPAEDLAVLIGAEGVQDPRSFDLPPRIYGPALDTPGADATEAFIQAGVPEWGRDYRDAQVFASDVNMDRLNGVDYKKGCFVGQEVASRMYRRGKIRKRTVQVRGAELAVGEAVKLGEVSLGEITSVAGEMALARLRIDRLGHASEALVAGKPVEIIGPDWLEAEVEALLVAD